MVLYDPERHWVVHGACRKLDPTPFFASTGQPDKIPTAAIQRSWAEAKEACSYCPVLAECQRDTLGEEYGVWGGRDERERYLIRTALSKRERYKKWPEGKRLEWGEHLAKLRSRGVSVANIQRLTGFMPKVVEALVSEWKASLPEEEPVVVDLPLPGLSKPQFPEVRGARSAWVRNGNLVADGWYAGETEDGKWIRMQIFSVRGQVKKFFRPEDVHFYTKRERWVVPYRRRPDAADVQEEAHAA